MTEEYLADTSVVIPT